MIIPSGYAHVVHYFAGSALPLGAATTYGVTLPGVLDPELVASSLHDLFGDEVVPGLSSGVTMTRTLVKFGPNATGAQGEWSETKNGTGSAGTAPPNVAMLVRKKTALGGRENRGRLYLPGVPEDSIQVSGVLDSSTVAAFQGRVNAWMTELDTYGANMVVLHNDASTPTPVINLVVDTRVATQRRRLR